MFDFKSELLICISVNILHRKLSLFSKNCYLFFLNGLFYNSGDEIFCSDSKSTLFHRKIFMTQVRTFLLFQNLMNIFMGKIHLTLLSSVMEGIFMCMESGFASDASVFCFLRYCSQIWLILFHLACDTRFYWSYWLPCQLWKWKK